VTVRERCTEGKVGHLHILNRVTDFAVSGLHLAFYSTAEIMLHAVLRQRPTQMAINYAAKKTTGMSSYVNCHFTRRLQSGLMYSGFDKHIGRMVEIKDNEDHEVQKRLLENKMLNLDYNKYDPPERFIPAILYYHAKHEKSQNLIPYFRRWARIVEQSPFRYWRPRDVANSFYGFRDIDLGSYSSGGVLELANALAQKASHEPSLSSHFGQLMSGIGSTRHIDKILAHHPTGKTQKAEIVENQIRSIFNMLTAQALSCQGLDGQGLSNVLYSFRHLNSNVPEVRRLVAAVATAILKVPDSYEGADREGQRTGTDDSLRMTGIALGNAVYGLKGLGSGYAEVRQLIAALNSRIKLGVTGEFDEQAVSNAFFGMQHLRPQYSEVLELVTLLADEIEKSPVRTVTSQGFGMALFGLRDMDADYPEVRRLLSLLSPMITGIPENDELLAGKETYMALYGFRRLSCVYPEVRKLVAAVAFRLRAGSHKISLDGRQIGSALYGLKRLNSDYSEVVDLLQTFINTCLVDEFGFVRPVMDGQSLSNALYGLQSMSSECSEVRQILSVLVSGITTTPQGSLSKQTVTEGIELTEQGISNCMSGLRNMSSDHVEVRQLLAALTVLIFRASKSVTLSGKSLAGCLLGLQRMSDAHQEVRAVIQVIGWMVSDSPKLVVNGEELANILFGMQGLDSGRKEVQRLVGDVAARIRLSLGQSFVSTKQILAFRDGHDLSRALYGMKSMSSENLEVRKLVAVITNCIPYENHGDLQFANAAEIAMALTGLGKMSADYAEVRGLLTLITDIIYRSPIKDLSEGSEPPVESDEFATQIRQAVDRLVSNTNSQNIALEDVKAKKEVGEPDDKEHRQLRVLIIALTKKGLL
jgi:hypothetical protein